MRKNLEVLLKNSASRYQEVLGMSAEDAERQKILNAVVASIFELKLVTLSAPRQYQSKVKTFLC